MSFCKLLFAEYQLIDVGNFAKSFWHLAWLSHLANFKANVVV